MKVTTDCWAPEWERIEEKVLRQHQLTRLQETLKQATKSPFYREKFRQAGLSFPKISHLEEIQQLPFTEKEDLRQSYPFGLVTVPLEKLVRLHASSGTTGKSTLIFHTKKDIDTWASLVARCLYMVGARPGDIFQNMMTYGLFTGGLGLHYGAEKIGLLVVPSGSGNTQKQIEFFRDIGTTLIHITPSYCLHLAQVVAEMELLPERDLKLRLAIMGAEPYSEATRKKLEKALNIKVYNCYGLSEMNGPGVAFECPFQHGLHLWEDHFFPEIIDPETGRVLPEGEEGELVLTTLQREGMPLIRYRTRDLTRFIRGICRCGRIHRRIERIKGRSDDMFIVKGVNIFPSQIETVLMEIPEVDANFLIIIDRKEGLDLLTVQVEIKQEYFRGDLQSLREIQEKIREKLKNTIIVNPMVELVEPGTIPPSTGKAKRVIDNRRL
ncbi:MAG: phenylacetate--CoA ligase [Candidatus Omnitrophica bacterium]|nr:phenylacetate--CoA ligase [Candidatus Omnitrophota bacterium]